MNKTASKSYCEMEEYENELAIETLNRVYFDETINPYRSSEKKLICILIPIIQMATYHHKN